VPRTVVSTLDDFALLNGGLFADGAGLVLQALVTWIANQPPVL
jgi:hypothetical protein